MPYCLGTELVAFLPDGVGTFAASTTPLALGEVDVILSEVSAELDGAAGHVGYLVPVASSTVEGFQLMQRWAKFGAAAQVLRIIFPNLGGPAATNTLASDYLAAYQAALKSLATGQTVLPNAPHDPGDTSRELPRSYSISYPGATSGVVPHFDTSTVF